MTGAQLMHYLTKEFYGLPVWAWGLIGIGGVGLGWYLTKNASNLFGGLTGSGTGATAGTGTPPTTPQMPDTPATPASTTTTTTTTTETPPPVAAVIPSGVSTDAGQFIQPTNPIQPTASQPSQGLSATVAAKRVGLAAYRAVRNTTVEQRSPIIHRAPQASAEESLVANAFARALTNQNTVRQRAGNQPYRSVVGRAQAV